MNQLLGKIRDYLKGILLALEGQPAANQSILQAIAETNTLLGGISTQLATIIDQQRQIITLLKNEPKPAVTGLFAIGKAIPQ